MSQLPKVYLAFYIAEKEVNPKLKFWDKVVCFFDKSPYSHVELVIQTGNEEYDCYSASIRDGGVRHKRMKLAEEHWVLVEVDIDHTRAMAVFKSQERLPYDWLGLISTKYYWFPSRQDAWFCSEICAAMCGIVDYSNYGIRRLYDWVKTCQSQSGDRAS